MDEAPSYMIEIRRTRTFRAAKEGEVRGMMLLQSRVESMSIVEV